MTTLEEWENNKTAAMQLDEKLMTSDNGWKVAKEKSGITIWTRSFPDDKNNMFKWVIPSLKADYKEVYDCIANHFHEYHQYFTVEYTGGYDVANPDEFNKVSYQQYDSGFKLISNRDWVVIQTTKVLNDKQIQIAYRSITHPDRPLVKGYERIDWWGGHIFEDNGDGTTKLYFVDRENQGGMFPAFLMNQMMPGYLIKQVVAFEKFFEQGGMASHSPMPLDENSARIQGLF